MRLKKKTKLVIVVVKDIAISGKILGSVLQMIESDTVLPTARHRGDVSSEMCCPGTKPRR